MENLTKDMKKFDITTLQVIDRSKLNIMQGGKAAPASFSSIADDTDTGGGCSLWSDIDK